MNSNMEGLFTQPQTCERGRSMRNIGKGFLKGLVLILAITPMMAAFAATSVTGIDHGKTGDGGVRISLKTSGDVPQVSVFATESPARIVLDLADTDSQAGTAPVHVGQGAVQQYSAITAGGRTRLVDLSRSSSYDYNAEAGQVVLTIAGGGEAASVSTAPAASSGGINVTGVDFRRGVDGQARVIVSLDKPGASISMREGANALSLDIFNANLPDSLDQRLDVIDFATPIQLIDTFGVSSGVRLDMSTKGLFEHLAYESGNDIIVEVTEVSRMAEAVEEAELKFFEEKTYEGTRPEYRRR